MTSPIEPAERSLVPLEAPSPVFDPAARREVADVLLGYQYAIDQMLTRLNVLREDFNYAHDYNPIEAVSGRLKSPESILEKATRKEVPRDLTSIQENILDIAGVRVTCAFITDIYTVRDLLVALPDVSVLQERDYIRDPKENGYKSLHLIVSMPVVRVRGTIPVTLEIQIRTIAMDFWASLEHKIHYKYQGAVPAHLVDDLRDAAEVANQLDVKMEQLHEQVRALQSPPLSA